MDFEDITNQDQSQSCQYSQGAEAPTEELDGYEPPRRRLPLASVILFALCGICVVLAILFPLFPAFSDFFNKYISSAYRGISGVISGILPFSIAELLLLSTPIIEFVIIRIGTKKYLDTWRNLGVFALILLSLASYIFSAFTIGFMPGYHGTSLDKKLGLNKQEVSADDLLLSSLLVANFTQAELDDVPFVKEGGSVMPYGYDELNDKLMEAYDSACEKYDFLQDFDSKFKRIMLSKPMTYTHISGVYTFFTGEANINTNYPDYTIPFTAAHEFAHQRGIAREDEANFVAFLVCTGSDDAYLRYCGYANMLDYLLSALYSANPSYYTVLYQTLDERIVYERYAYSQFYDKYRDNIVGEISGSVNNTFLTMNGTEGTRSYGMVVDLAVAYFNSLG